MLFRKALRDSGVVKFSGIRYDFRNNEFESRPEVARVPGRQSDRAPCRIRRGVDDVNM
jgi:hypothetical protein